MDALRIVGTKSEEAAQVVAQVQCAWLWVGGLQIAGTWMGGLRIVGTKSEEAAQVEAQVQCT